MGKVLHLIPEDWFFWTHRRAVARATLEQGHEVVVACRVGRHKELIESLGIRVLPVGLRRESRNPFYELATIREIVELYRRERPDLVHHTAVKPVVYGSIAARITGVPRTLNAIPGLGHSFSDRSIRGSLSRLLVSTLYRQALSLNAGKSLAVFENSENQATLMALNIVDRDDSLVIRGMGCDLEQFSPVPEVSDDTVTVMMAGRLLWSKGIAELVQAVQLLRLRGLKVKLVLVGDPDVGNPASVPAIKLREWAAADLIEWVQRTDNVQGCLARCHILALPSRYGEGLPKVLIEAAAVGRALIASDIPGCRDIVRHGWNGLLVPPGDTQKLAAAIETLATDSKMRRLYGTRGTELVREFFSDRTVNSETMRAYRRLGLASPAAAGQIAR